MDFYDSYIEDVIKEVVLGNVCVNIGCINDQLEGLGR